MVLSPEEIQAVCSPEVDHDPHNGWYARCQACGWQARDYHPLEGVHDGREAAGDAAYAAAQADAEEHRDAPAV